MKDAIVIVSFGTRDTAAAEASFGQLAQDAVRRWPDRRVLRAVMGGVGEPLPQVLGRLEEQGTTHLQVCPAYLTRGTLYRQVEQTVREHAPHFAHAAVTPPLLDGPADAERLAELLSRRFPAQRGWNILFAAHGSTQDDGQVYRAVEHALHRAGRTDCLVGTLSGRPGPDELAGSMEGERVLLVPLLLSAGSHATRDLAGDGPDSWKRRLQARGFAVEAAVQGMGEWPEVRELFLSRIQ